MSDVESTVQISTTIPLSLWERIQADARGLGQVVIDALDAHLPEAPERPVEVAAPETPAETIPAPSAE